MRVEQRIGRENLIYVIGLAHLASMFPTTIHPFALPLGEKE